MSAPVILPNWTFPGRVVRVRDGDTLVVALDRGRFSGGGRDWHEGAIRIRGLWCPEMNEEGGPEARTGLVDLLLEGREEDEAIGLRFMLLSGWDPRPQVICRTLRGNPQDPYGRIVADVWTHDGRSVAEIMIEREFGFAERPS